MYALLEGQSKKIAFLQNGDLEINSTNDVENFVYRLKCFLFHSVYKGKLGFTLQFISMCNKMVTSEIRE